MRVIFLLVWLYFKLWFVLSVFSVAFLVCFFGLSFHHWQSYHIYLLLFVMNVTISFIFSVIV